MYTHIAIAIATLLGQRSWIIPPQYRRKKFRRNARYGDKSSLRNCKQAITCLETVTSLLNLKPVQASTVPIWDTNQTTGTLGAPVSSR